MTKKPIFDIVSKPQLRNTFTDDPDLKARVSTLRIGPDWETIKAVAQAENARNPARDRAKAEAQRIAGDRWAAAPSTITAMTEHVVSELAQTDFGTWSEKAVRGWIKDLAPSHKPGRPRDV